VFWGLGVGLGLALPLALCAVAFGRGARGNARLQLAAVAATSACILVGGYFFRLAVVLGGQAALPASTPQ